MICGRESEKFSVTEAYEGNSAPNGWVYWRNKSNFLWTGFVGTKWLVHWIQFKSREHAALPSVPFDIYDGTIWAGAEFILFSFCTLETYKAPLFPKVAVKLRGKKLYSFVRITPEFSNFLPTLSTTCLSTFSSYGNIRLHETSEEREAQDVIYILYVDMVQFKNVLIFLNFIFILLINLTPWLTMNENELFSQHIFVEHSLSKVWCKPIDLQSSTSLS